MEPWTCPRCDVVNAPWMAQCTCAPLAHTAGATCPECYGYGYIADPTRSTGERSCSRGCLRVVVTVSPAFSVGDLTADTGVFKLVEHGR